MSNERETYLDYVAQQFARVLDLDVRDFDVDIDDETETTTVHLMTDDEPEKTWEFQCGSDDDAYVFVNLDDENDLVQFDLMPE